VRLFNETKEALEQQTATSEILRVIASSPTDIQPVLDVVAENAARLCEAKDAVIRRIDGDTVRVVATYGPMPTAAIVTPITGRVPVGRAIIDRQTIHVHDVAAEFEEIPESPHRMTGTRTLLVTPLLREGVPIGVINVRRTEVRPFTEKQIALLKTFADQAVIAIENVRLFQDLEARNRDLSATSEILRVISSSPTDVQPVFDAIALSAMRLCDATFCNVARYDGDRLHLAAHAHTTAEGIEAMEQLFPMRPSRATALGRAVFEAAVAHLPDLQRDAEYSQPLRAALRARSALGVPLLRDGQPIGAIAVGRSESHPFTQDQIALLQTFADQAVIAIENVRLFTELQEKNRALTAAHAQVTESLEQQTATSEILSVISRSPTDVQPVFDVIAQSARRLCDGNYCTVARYDGELVHLAAHAYIRLEGVEAMQRFFTKPPSRALALGRTILDRAVVHIPDALADPEYDQSVAQAVQFRSIVGVPMLRDGASIGAITVSRAEARPFTETEIALLKTFADQAVIAIENVRLFKELEIRNRDLTAALDQQTATSEILRVISSSLTDVQPVFDAIVRSAGQLCEADFGGLHLLDAGHITIEAHYNAMPGEYEVWKSVFPTPVGRHSASGRAILDCVPVQINDVRADPDYGFSNITALDRHRTLLAVPMLREGEPIGTISVWRGEVRPFTDKQIALLQTFADQAVIAIENVRLFKELETRTHDLTRSVGELTALGEVGRALSSTLNLEVVLQIIVTRASQLTGTAGCVIWEYDKPREEFRLRVSHYADDTDAAILPTSGGVTTIPRGQGLTTQVMEERQAVQIPDITVEGAYESPVRKPLIDAGHRALLGVPLLSEDEVVGVLAVTRKTPGEFAPEIVRLLTTFATQSALAIQNARLFLEIEDKSRQLELASQHKSEFLANMSHELRTPLNAIIGFSEVLTERMFGELNEKQEEYLKDIYASGTHLLSLINDILDLSKIEAGRMELELTDFDLPQAIENALILIRERAGRRGIALEHSVDERLGEIRGDERKVKQVLLNLLSNALKFTPEGGRVEVRAGLVDGMAEISVTDTGVGIAPEDQGAIFEEFRQVGTADKKAEGTGLGLTLCRKFVELHGGRIWVKSQVGAGSTFTFTIPARRGE
jgi:GAF domain-containing protein